MSRFSYEFIVDFYFSVLYHFGSFTSAANAGMGDVFVQGHCTRNGGSVVDRRGCRYWSGIIAWPLCRGFGFLFIKIICGFFFLFALLLFELFFDGRITCFRGKLAKLLGCLFLHDCLLVYNSILVRGKGNGNSRKLQASGLKLYVLACSLRLKACSFYLNEIANIIYFSFLQRLAFFL